MKTIILFSILFFPGIAVNSQSIPLDSAVLFITEIGSVNFTRNAIVVFHYNEKLLPDTKYFIDVNSITGDTTDLGRDLLTYNDLGQIISVEGQRWDTAKSEWNISRLEITSYGGNQKPDTAYLYFYSANEILYGMRTIYEYDFSDELISEHTENWGFDQKWTNKSKCTYAYGLLSGQPTLLNTTRYTWFNQNWQFYSRLMNTYNSDRQVIKTLNQLWDPTYTKWVNDYKSNSHYDVSKRLVNTAYYTWELGSIWEREDSTSYQYDEFNNLIQETYFNGTNISTEPWKPVYRAEATYNIDIDFSSIIWPLESGLLTAVPFTKQLIQFIESDYDSGWIEDDKVVFYYGKTTGVLDVNYLTDAIYPNPASDEVWLNLSNPDDNATLQLYSANGQRVAEWKISQHESLNIDHLPTGVYFYFIRNGEKNYVGKLMISR